MSEQNIPADRKYSKSHEWVKLEGDEAVIGISDHAQHQMGDVVYVALPAVGSALEAGGPAGEIESVKAAERIYSPVSGTVLKVNDQLATRPEQVNRDPYGAGWMLRVKLSSPALPDGLLDAAAYRAVAEG